MNAFFFANRTLENAERLANIYQGAAFELNELVPNKPLHETIRKRRESTYKGAFVFEPKPGLYNNLVVFDFRGLYSSIIVAHNICLSTLTKESKDAYKSPEIDVGNKKVRYYFNYKKEGFIPRIVKELIERRIRVKGILKLMNTSPVNLSNAYLSSLVFWPKYSPVVIRRLNS